MLTIYGSARSRASRVLWLAMELGIPYTHQDYLPRSPETRTPAFLKLNPNGSVPVIEDDGFVLWESMAINMYLARKHGSALHLTDPRQEALVWQWSLWETDRLDRQLVNYVNASTGPEANRKPDVAEAMWKEVVPAMTTLDGALAGRQWLIGNAFSIADLNVASALYRGLFLDLGQWPNAKAWLERCWERPAAKKVRAMRE